MIAGLPGTGIGGLFYLLLIALMPLRALARRPAHAPSPWPLVGRQVALALGVLASLWAQAELLRRALSHPAVRSTLGGHDPARVFGAHTHTWLLASALGSAMSLALVLVAVRAVAALVRRGRGQGGGAIGAQVETPAPTMRKPTSRMYPVSIVPSEGR